MDTSFKKNPEAIAEKLKAYGVNGYLIVPLSRKEVKKYSKVSNK